jgi:histidinol dehydrogenase
MRIVSGPPAERRVNQIAGRGSQLADLEPQVRRIIEDVREHGDGALRHYAEKWDGLARSSDFRVPQVELEAAWTMASSRLRGALRQAAANIRRFCACQRPSGWKRKFDDRTLGQVIRPLGSVGCYVPAGRHPLVSTLLMTVIPAQTAGVRDIRVVSPNPQLEVMAAAHMLGVGEFYRVGGAQAVAALAYGTKSVPRVDKIVGPGNQYVTIAKKLVSFDCAIDFLAGPSEAVILSHRGRADFIAADLMAQAEHDPAALPVFITTSARLAHSVSAKMNQLVRDNRTAEQSVKHNGAILLAKSRKEATDWANRIAPEHITVEAQDVPHIQNAGSIFVGDYSAQAAGDYASGPNHVLPTAGVARFRGGLSVMDFAKIITIQRLTKEGLERIGKTVVHLAETEGLLAHAKSIRVRCPNV